jgi:hypothetical protein
MTPPKPNHSYTRKLVTIAAAVALVALVTTACTSQIGSSPSGLSGATPTANVVSQATSTPTAPATQPSATQTPTTTPSAELSASVVKVRETIRPCTSSGFVQAMVIIELKNEGTGWAELQGGDYTIYDGSENVLGTGSFSYSYPPFLAPGATGYLADGAYIEGAKASEVKRVEADGTFDEADEADVIELKTAKIQIKRESYGDGLYVTGTVTNTSTEDVSSAHVGAFFLDTAGRPIGFSYTNLVENLTAGKTKGFETVASDCPIKRTSVAKVVVLAGSSY